MSDANQRAAEQALLLLAAYERPDADAYEKEIVRLARQWRRIVKSAHTTQGVVNRLLEEIDRPRPEGFGSGWDHLRAAMVEWAAAEGWLEGEALRGWRERLAQE